MGPAVFSQLLDVYTPLKTCETYVETPLEPANSSYPLCG